MSQVIFLCSYLPSCQLLILWSPSTAISVSSTREVHWVLPQFLLPTPCLGNFLQEVNWDNIRAVLVCCLSFRDIFLCCFSKSCKELFHTFCPFYWLFQVLCCAQLLRLFAASWTVACQAPLTMGMLQARILEWGAMLSSRGSFQLRD